jgi:hypothetical protein
VSVGGWVVEVHAASCIHERLLKESDNRWHVIRMQRNNRSLCTIGDILRYADVSGFADIDFHAVSSVGFTYIHDGML